MKINTAPLFLVLLLLFPQNSCLGQRSSAPIKSKAQTQARLNLALLKSAESGDFEDVKTLLARGAFINATDREGNTPLHDAADGGYVAIAKLLLDHGANYRIKNKYGSTPLWLTGRQESPANDAENKAIAKLIRQRMAYDRRHKHSGGKIVNRV